MREYVRAVQSAMMRAAAETSGHLTCEIVEETEEGSGRWICRLPGGDQITLFSTACSPPMKGQKWNISRCNGILVLSGPAGYG